MRNALLDYTPILPATACHQNSDVETYSRYRNQTAFLVVWGTDDDLVDPHSQSEAFVTALKQAGFFVRTVIVPGAPHFWMWDPLDEPTSFTGFVAPRLLRFLQQQL
jgi:pimeloyl-ACP methyl ester carboxylesterase